MTASWHRQVITTQRRLISSLFAESAGQEEDHQVHEMVVSSAVETIFRETAPFTHVAPRKGFGKKSKLSKSWSKSGWQRKQ